MSETRQSNRSRKPATHSFIAAPEGELEEGEEKGRRGIEEKKDRRRRLPL